MTTHAGSVVATAVAALFALTVSGCTSQETTPELSAADIATAEHSLNALTERIFGSPAERRAGEILVYHAVQDPLKHCITSAGFSYTAEPFVDIYASESAPSIPDGIGLWTAPLSKDRVGSGITETTERAHERSGPEVQNRYYVGLSAQDRARYNMALENCTRRPTDLNVNFPAMTPTLDTALARLVSSVERRGDVKAASAGYRSCMADAGIPASGYQDLVADVQARVSKATVPAPGEQPTTQWIDVVAFERKAATADANCRRAAHDLVLVLLAPKLVTFQSDHANELATVDEQWAVIVATASKFAESR